MLKFDDELVRFLQQVQTVNVDSIKIVSALWRKAKSLAKATNKTDPLLWLADRLELEMEALQAWDDPESDPLEMDAAICDCLVQIYQILPQMSEKLQNIREEAIVLPSLEAIFTKSDALAAAQATATSD